MVSTVRKFVSSASVIAAVSVISRTSVPSPPVTESLEARLASANLNVSAPAAPLALSAVALSVNTSSAAPPRMVTVSLPVLALTSTVSTSPASSALPSTVRPLVIAKPATKLTVASPAPSVARSLMVMFSTPETRPAPTVMVTALPVLSVALVLLSRRMVSVPVPPAIESSVVAVVSSWNDAFETITSLPEPPVTELSAEFASTVRLPV